MCCAFLYIYGYTAGDMVFSIANFTQQIICLDKPLLSSPQNIALEFFRAIVQVLTLFDIVKNSATISSPDIPL